MYLWKAVIRTRWGDIQVSTQAPNQHIARKILESKYGEGTILGNEVRQS